jgi:hypothetical protein
MFFDVVVFHWQPQSSGAALLKNQPDSCLSISQLSQKSLGKSSNCLVSFLVQALPRKNGNLGGISNSMARRTISFRSKAIF